jgi:hypothetical protein
MQWAAALLANAEGQGMWHAFMRCIRAQQVRAPLNLDIIILLESIDPILADIAVWSNVIREDDDGSWVTL